MPQHDQTTAKERYCDWCKHINNQCCYNRELWSEKQMKGGHMIMQLLHNRWIPNSYYQGESQSNWNEKPKYLNGINFTVKKICCVCNRHISADFGKFISKVCKLIRYEGKLWKLEEKLFFVIPRNKTKLRHWLTTQNYWDRFWKNNKIFGSNV